MIDSLTDHRISLTAIAAYSCHCGRLGPGTSVERVYTLANGTTEFAVRSAHRDLVKHGSPELAAKAEQLLALRLGAGDA